MTSDQADAMLVVLNQMAGLLARIQFCTQVTAVVSCFIFGGQIFRLVLQAKNSKNVF